ncbi:Extradiol ring-cleavage dioxygenase, class III enzyme, subunit B [Chytridium lagenaria]|nr:Extradiol ring-cleavage dioxygenase, class III enzyme, subunit B [Chytridium lagenaria]
MVKQPTYFLCHGTPNWLVQPANPGPTFLNSLGAQILASPSLPRCILMVSAHWETKGEVRITGRAEHGKLLYDYYNFPKEYYDVEYPAKEIRRLRPRFPKQEIPVVVVSLPVTNNPEDYFRLGDALKPLRDENVLIIGGGFLTHNLSEFRNQMMFVTGTSPTEQWASGFIQAVEDAVLTPTNDQDRRKGLLNTFSHKFYTKSHPTPEHYAPLLVAAAAAGSDPAKLIHSSWEMGIFSEDSFVFGEVKREE